MHIKSDLFSSLLTKKGVLRENISICGVRECFAFYLIQMDVNRPELNFRRWGTIILWIHVSNDFFGEYSTVWQVIRTLLYPFPRNIFEIVVK
jgi:hypothetical protein